MPEVPYWRWTEERRQVSDIVVMKPRRINPHNVTAKVLTEQDEKKSHGKQASILQKQIKDMHFTFQNCQGAQSNREPNARQRGKKKATALWACFTIKKNQDYHN